MDIKFIDDYRADKDERMRNGYERREVSQDLQDQRAQDIFGTNLGVDGVTGVDYPSHGAEEQ